MLGLFWMAVANAAILLGAHEILRKVRTGIAALDVILFLLARLALVSLAVLAALCAGIFNATALGVLGSLALAILLAAGAHRRLPSFRWPGVGRAGTLLGILVVVRLLLQVWFFAPSIPDVVSYHLPKLGEWISHGALTREHGLDPRSAFPAGFELVEAWWVVFLRHDALIEAAGVEFLALGVASAFALGRWIGLPERGAWLAAALYGLVPGLHLQATSCMNDGPLASTVVATAALIAMRVPYPFVVLSAGLAAGIKPTFGYIIPGLALLAWMTRKEAPTGGLASSGAAALAVAGVLLGGFWYARNTVLHRNPLHPMTQRGVLDPHGDPLVPPHPSLSNLASNAGETVSRRLMDRASPYSVQLQGLGGWGVGAIALGLPALIVSLRSNASMRRLFAALSVAVAMILASVYGDPWYMRFLLFFPVLPCLAAAWLVDRFPATGWVAGAALLLQFLGTFVPQEMPDQGLKELASTPWRERTGAPFPGGVQVPRDAIGCQKFGRIYPLYGPGFSRRVVYLRAATFDEMERALRRESLAMIFADSSNPVVRECVAQGSLRRTIGYYFEVVRR